MSKISKKTEKELISKVNKLKESFQKLRDKRKDKKGMGPMSTLAMIFIVLKVLGIYDSSWLYVLSPLWIPIAFYVGIAIIMFPVVWIQQSNRGK